MPSDYPPLFQVGEWRVIFVYIALVLGYAFTLLQPSLSVR